MESKETGTAASLFQFELGFWNTHLEIVNLKVFAKWLNIYFPFF